MLYRSIEVISSHDIYDFLSDQHSRYYTFGNVTAVLGNKAPNNIREVMSQTDLWSYSYSDEDPSEMLKMRRLEWIDAMQSCIQSLLQATKATSFYILGEELYITAYFEHTVNGEDVCIISSASPEFFERLKAYGACPRLLQLDNKERATHEHLFKRLTEGLILACYGRIAVLSAAAAIIESVSPPLKTTKHYLRVPHIVASAPFTNASEQHLHWQMLANNKRFRYKATGYMFPQTIETLSAAITAAWDDAALLPRPLHVPLDDREVLSKEMLEATAPLQAPVAAPKRVLRNPFTVVRTVAARPVEVLARKTSLAADAEEVGDFVSIRSSAVETALAFGYVEEAARLCSEGGGAEGAVVKGEFASELSWTAATAEWRTTRVELPSLSLRHALPAKENIYD